MCLGNTTEVSLEGRVIYYKLENVSWIQMIIFQWHDLAFFCALGRWNAGRE